MNWDVPYVVSRALVLQIGNGGELLARNSVSRQPQKLALDALPVLLAFAGGRAPREALAALQAEWELDADGFAEVVRALVAQNLLTPAGADAAAAPAAGGFASAAAQYGMIRDRVRVMTYQRAIFNHCRDKTVVEIGCGTGILSIFAAQAGARRVIAIEESRIADLAAEMFAANGVADRIELRRANSRDVVLDEKADVIIHEILGTDPFAENMIPFIEDARERFLAPGGRLIPFAVDVCCAGFEVADRPYPDRSRVVAEIRELEGTYGVDFGALRRFLAAADPNPFPRPVGDLGTMHFNPRILTEDAQLYRIDFRPGASLAIDPRREVRLRATQRGTLGGIVVYFRAYLDETTILSTSPYSEITSWGWDARGLDELVPVEQGDEVGIIAELRTVLGLEKLHVGLTPGR